MYDNYVNYLTDNELFDEANDVANDVKNEQVILMIEDHFNDEVMLRESSLAELTEMLRYYNKHS